MTVYQYPLGEQARVHIRTLLERGNTFARTVLSEVPLDKGPVTAVFSSPVDQSKLNEFEWGGKMPQPPYALMTPIPNSHTAFVSIVQDFLQANNLHLCLCENALSQPTDPVLAKFKSRLYTFNQEVYSVLLSVDYQEDMILQARKESHTFPHFISALIAQPNQLFSTEPMRGVFTQDTLTILARNLKSLIAGAYDGEGYLVWHLND